MRLRERHAQVRGGFTLMELLVVVAILVVLAGAAVPIYMRFLDDAKVSRARIDVKMIADALESYSLAHGGLPPSLDALVNPPDGGRPYFEATKLMDPWNQQYQYGGPGQVSPAGKPYVFTMGSPSHQMKIDSWGTTAGSTP